MEMRLSRQCGACDLVRCGTDNFKCILGCRFKTKDLSQLYVVKYVDELQI